MKDLKTQLVEFAARRVVSEIVGITARNLEKRAREELGNRRLRNAVKSTSTSTSISTSPPKSRERTSKMARTEQTVGFSEPNTRTAARAAAAAAAQDSIGSKEPIEFWVNTVMVDEDGAEPKRFLTGRPLKSFKATRAIGTSNEEFNEVNLLNNTFVMMLHSDADKLDLGESRYYSPAPKSITYDDEGNRIFKAGMYIQLHREKTDYALAAAEKQDAEATAHQRLRNLFGNS